MIKMIFISSLMGMSTLLAEIPEPYYSTVDLPFDPHGWFLNESQLEVLLKDKQPETIVEVGCWLGCSTRYLASKLKAGGKLYAVDTWAGSSQEAVHMSDPRLPYLYQLFLSNIKHAGLTDRIIPVRMNSLEASKALNVKADLIYLDGAHDTGSVTADILSWNNHLANGGILCGDDWQWPSVQVAVNQCATILNKRVIADGNFWKYE